ncbi:cytidine deaminase [Clostridium sp. YIM B02505]|uniref:Cytidine deaminase n=1 Tax=Clostridium yunnanense TaxID=2800325 RepID=A0ABS1ENI2_9CLOT|nr:cytidine deaminase [Clostridium yunnanense]MBK1810899.1 cytidine deaminase [Clostridium yunnanense]
MDKYQDIIDRAFKAAENAYVPYSNYQVGACVLTKDNKYFIGANVENASYGLTNCAERNAIFQAYSNGYRQEDIEAIAIVSNGKTLATPCGACRQVLVELLERHTPIVLSNHKVEKITNIEELLPMSFTKEDLD